MQQFFISNIIANAGIRYEDNSVYGGFWAPQAGITWHANEEMTLKALISKGFRSPTIKDLYLFPVANINLKPEEVWNYELGILNSIQENFYLESSFFISKGNNLILTEGVPPSAKLVNSGNFSHKGFELFTRYKPLDNLLISAGYSYLDPGQQTRANPKHKILASMNYNLEKFDIKLDIKTIRKLYGDDNYRNPMSDYTLLNMIISYNIINNTYIRLSCDNMLNKIYETIKDYPMPGRIYSLGISTGY